MVKATDSLTIQMPEFEARKMALVVLDYIQQWEMIHFRKRQEARTVTFTPSTEPLPADARDGGAGGIATDNRNDLRWSGGKIFPAAFAFHWVEVALCVRYNRGRKCSPMKQRGFTLIELLVVIAHHRAARGHHFPVFATVRGKARQIVCVSNMRQIGMAIFVVRSGRR